MNIFSVDIDGCITNGKGKFTDAKIVSLIHKEIEKNSLSFFFTTGRSAPYVEALAQFLNINQWCICENGAYLYNPMTDKVLYNPLIKQDTLIALKDLEKLLSSKPYTDICVAELGKSICISLNPKAGTIEDLYKVLLSKIDQDLLYINHSTTAVDITPKGVDKGSALMQLAEIEGYKLKHIVSIGDSSGDLPVMKLTGKKACPQNATYSVKRICDYISPYETTEGILDIIRKFNNL